MYRAILSATFWLILPSFINAQADFEKKLQSQLILVDDGDTIRLPEGRFKLSNTLSLDEKKRVTVRGAGEGKTVLSFAGQKHGAEGMKVTNSSDIVLEHFTIEDAKGDLIKTQTVKGLVFRHITAQWTGKPKKENGSYALYPVQCQRVTIENCTAIGASDAGIYVGQSDSVWVYGCNAYHNVAGIEIENTTNAWVHHNRTFHNTGGLLVFDLPDLPKKKGGHVEVYENDVTSNNFKNFAPKGNIVGKVPPGTGVMVLATNDVLIRNNKITNHKTASCALISYYITETPIKDKDYTPYPADITIKDNQFTRKKQMPTWKNKLGFLFWLKFGRKVPNILWDGIENPDWQDASGKLKPEYKICISGNTNETFANLKADQKFKGIVRSMDGHKCE